MVNIPSASHSSPIPKFHIKSNGHEIAPSDLIGWTFDRYRLGYELARSNQQKDQFQQFRFISAEFENNRIGLLMAEITRFSIQVHSIFVLNSWRRKSIATSMLRTLIDELSQLNNTLSIDANFVEVFGNQHSIRGVFEKNNFLNPELAHSIYDLDADILASLRWVRPLSPSNEWSIQNIYTDFNVVNNYAMYKGNIEQWCEPELRPNYFFQETYLPASFMLLDADKKIAGWVLGAWANPSCFVISSLYVHPQAGKLGAIGWLTYQFVHATRLLGAKKYSFMTNTKFPGMLKVAQKHLAPSVTRHRQSFNVRLELSKQKNSNLLIDGEMTSPQINADLTKNASSTSSLNRFIQTYDLKLYRWKYIDDPKGQMYVGVMAQDLLEIPELKHAVIVGDDGFYRVNYHALGLKMLTYEEWLAGSSVSI